MALIKTNSFDWELFTVDDIKKIVLFRVIIKNTSVFYDY